MTTPIRKSSVARNLMHPIGVEAGLNRLRQQPDPAAHAEAMMRQLILTDFGERAMRPEFGTGLRGMVFESLKGASETLIRASVFSSLKRWLDDVVRVDAVTVEIEETTLKVRIIYTLRIEPGRRILTMETTV